jgi:signal transduction histidine kinase
LIRKLEDAHNQLLQSEKMASVGQLAAGVAHEINNPIGYINSNLGTLRGYVERLLDVVDAYAAAEALLPAGAVKQQIEAAKSRADLVYLKTDLVDLMTETSEGIDRVRRIVQDLKDFSHVDQGDWMLADLHKGLESTLNVVNNEIKYKARVVKEYGELPMLYCLPSQLNQVFMNLLVNAAHAIKDQGTITLRSGTHDEEAWVEIADTGSGIPAHLMTRIFDPFFTTKPVGQGTGLGLSISYGIVQKHGGRIEVESEPGQGSTFRVVLPIQRA